jgi:hypothetical protein
MMMRVWLGGASVGVVLAVSGCPNPNTYTTPRTLDPGKVQWQVAPEVIGVNYKTTNGSTDANGNLVKTNAGGVLPMLPSFGMRIGLADGLELGLRAPNLEPAAADAKIRLVKGSFDMALDPGLQFYFGSSNGNGYATVFLHAPLLLGFNLSEKTSIVLSPGLVYAQNTASGVVATAVTGSSAVAGFMGQLGVGVDFRTSHRFSVHPEITVMQQFTGSQDLFLVVGGIGFNFGAQPDYSDLRGDAGPPAEPTAPADSAPPAVEPASPPPSPPSTEVGL